MPTTAISHGAIVGIHNGIIVNDEELFAEHGWERAEPEMTVDSEAIFALAEERPGDARALEELYGAMATAWLDRRAPAELFLARGVGRPLWTGEGRDGVAFASTREALELAESYAGLSLAKHEVPEGTFVTVAGGRIVAAEGFDPDRSFREEVALPAVRAPEERISCRRLAVLAAAPASLGLFPAFGSRQRSRHRRPPDLPLPNAPGSGIGTSPRRRRRPRRAGRPATPSGATRLPRTRRPIREARQPAEPLRECATLIERPARPLLPRRHVEPCLTQRGRKRAEGVPDE